MKQPSKTRLLVASGLIALLLGTASVLSANVGESKASLVAVKKSETQMKNKSAKTQTKKNGKKTQKKKSSMKVNKKLCANLQKWASEGKYTKNVLARNWPYTADFNGDGREELVLQVQCVKAGYDVSF